MHSLSIYLPIYPSINPFIKSIRSSLSLSLSLYLSCSCPCLFLTPLPFLVSSPSPFTHTHTCMLPSGLQTAFQTRISLLVFFLVLMNAHTITCSTNMFLKLHACVCHGDSPAHAKAPLQEGVRGDKPQQGRGGRSGAGQGWREGYTTMQRELQQVQLFIRASICVWTYVDMHVKEGRHDVRLCVHNVSSD